MRGRRRVSIGGLLGLGLVAITAGPAWAQMGMGGQIRPVVQPDAKPNPDADRATNALPGATPGRGARPADKSTTDLAPNTALFDAINRGDIGEARDAVNRGADIHAMNVLGMTPIELSVDLSRNDITFFLMSLRGASSGGMSAKQVAKAAAEAPVLATKRLARTARAAVPRHAPAPAPAPRQFAVSADPGQPDPQAGFLGFGGTH